MRRFLVGIGILVLQVSVAFSTPATMVQSVDVNVGSAPVIKIAGQTPIRKPYTGKCDCPYDRKRNGKRCGGNSAYSKKGGRGPRCYK